MGGRQESFEIGKGVLVASCMDVVGVKCRKQTTTFKNIKTLCMTTTRNCRNFE